MKKLQLLLIGCLFLLSACFKQEGDLLVTLPAEEPHPAGTTIYPSNDQEVLAQQVDENGNITWIFGRFDNAGIPVGIAAASFQPADGNLRYHLLFDEEGRLSFLYASRSNGERLPDLMRFRYPAESRGLLSRYTTDWMSDYRLEWEVLIDQQAGTAIPTFLRNECGQLQAAAQSVLTAGALLETAADVRFLSFPDWLSTAWPGPLSGAVEKLNDACDESLRFAENGPPASVVPDNPGRMQESLESNTDIQPCAENPPQNFEVERDVNGNLSFGRLLGGIPPFTFSFNGSDFQADADFSGPVPPDQVFLMMARDSRGCILAKIGKPIPAPPQKGLLQQIRFQDSDETYDIDFSYDPQDRVKQIITDGSQVMEYEYVGDKLIRVVFYNQSTPSDKSFEEYLYGSDDRLLEIRRRKGATTTAVFACTYDSQGRLMRYERQDDNFEEGKETLFGYTLEYDDQGNIKVLKKVIRESSAVKRLSRYDFTHDNTVNPLDLIGVYLEPLHRFTGQLEPLIANRWFSQNSVRQTRILGPTGQLEAQYDFEYQYDARDRLNRVTRRRSGGGLMGTTTLVLTYQ